MRRHPLLVLNVLIALLAALGCASGTGSGARRSGSPFPTPKELDKLEAPPDAPFAELRYDNVESWTLEGPFPNLVGVAPRAGAGELDAMLQSAVARRAGLAVASEAMHCTAREIARFVAQRKAQPPPSLVEFTAARCGAVGISMRTFWYHASIPARVPDEEIVAAWRSEIESLAQKSLSGGAVDVGIAMGRAADYTAVVIVSAVRRAHVEPFVPIPSGGRLAITGDVLGDVEDLSAWVNLGSLGYARCDVAPDVQLPRFALSCPVAAGDPTAAIDMTLHERGRVLGEGAMHVLARRSESEGHAWKSVRHAPSRVAASPAEFAKAISEALGTVRLRAALPPLTLSSAQSAEMDEFVPHVLAPSVGAGSSAMADLAALGIIAGWNVDGAIRDAGFATAIVMGPLDAGRWVDAALERPAFRATLLDPEATVLGVGTLAAEGAPVIAAVAATYQLFGEQSFADEAAAYIDRITSARTAKGRAAPHQVKDLSPLLEAAVSDVRDRGISPESALEDAMARAVTQTGRPVRGYWVEALRSGDLQVPEELAALEELNLAVAVGYYQPTDMPWGRVVALVLYEPPELGI